MNKYFRKFSEMLGSVLQCVGMFGNVRKVFQNPLHLYIMNGTATGHHTSNFSVFLLGAILNIMAAVDYASLIDYSVKAIAGGIIWLAFKLLSDYLTKRMNKNKTNEK